jgi:hypothetical protein
MTRGFVIMAQDTEKVSYTNCAKALEISIKRVMPNANVTIITTDMLPHGDVAPDSDWKLANDWQVYEASPYDETIKLEADMFIPKNIDYWWNILCLQDMVVCNKIRDFKGEISTARGYRRFIDDNNLPDLYNAITYFKKSDTAEQFFKIVRNVFENWEEYKSILKCNQNEKVTTDWAYAIAGHIIGIEKITLPTFNDFSMTHMKQFINGLPGEDWTQVLIYECLPESLRISTFVQMYPLHYHIKSFSDKLLETYTWKTL